MVTKDDQLVTTTTCRAKLVDLALDSGKIYESEGFKYIHESFQNGTLHLVGLLSDGGVHSRFDQLQVDTMVPPPMVRANFLTCRDC